MTHLAPDIRTDALALLEWLLEVAQEDVITSPGGWVKTLNCFMSMMGWAVSSGSTKWTSASKASFGKGGQSLPRQLLMLACFIRAGLTNPEAVPLPVGGGMFPLWEVERHMIPTRSNAYAHLNLFGSLRDEEGEMYIDREDRQRVFHKCFQSAVEIGIESARKEAGEAGRAAAVLTKALRDGMSDYAGVEDTQ